MKKTIYFGISLAFTALVLLSSCPSPTPTPLELEIEPSTSSISVKVNDEISGFSIKKSPADATGEFSINPDLPDGLNIDKTTGVISGSTATAKELTTYTITFTGSGKFANKTASANLTIEIYELNITLSNSSIAVKVNKDISGFSITKNPADATGVFSIKPDLPDGLQIDPTNGVISGSTATAREPTTYTITFTGSGKFANKTASANLTIEIYEIGIIPSSNSIQVGINQNVSGFSIRKDPANATGVYSIKPDLPEGLQIDPTTGAISGAKTTAMAPTQYVITFTGTGSFLNKEATTTITIQVYKLVINPSNSSILVKINEEISGFSITKTPEFVTGIYSINPPLPNGLNFDTTSGTISGIPAAAHKSDYTITFNSNGDFTGNSANTIVSIEIYNLTLTANVKLLKANRNEEFTESITYTRTPDIRGDYSITPTLPNGLNFNADSGQINGTPVVASEQTAYTITLIGSGDHEGKTAETTLDIIVYKHHPENRYDLIDAIENEFSAQNSSSPNLNNINTDLITEMYDIFNTASRTKHQDNYNKFNGDVSGWDVSKVTNMTRMFAGSPFNKDISKWDVSSVKNMEAMFTNSSFNGDISSWNVSSVINMSDMHSNSQFNGDLSQWNMQSVTDISNMFLNNTVFNQQIGKADPKVGSFEKMTSVFEGATSFNQDLDTWDVSKVTDMSSVFKGASSFNGNIRDWNVSKVTDMKYMFNGASDFNQNIGGWTVTEVTNMERMFAGASKFNQNLSTWSTTNVSNLTEMFAEATAFNGNISTWDMKNVERMAKILYKASAFNQEIGNWFANGIHTNNTDLNQILRGTAFNKNLSHWNDRVSGVTDMSYMFADTPAFNQDISGWDVSNVTDMSGMFYRATAFNQPLNNWGMNVGKVTNMSFMFSGAQSFNQPLNQWDVSEVTNMNQMFKDATVFNGNNTTWVVSKVTNMREMFQNAKAFDQNISGWNVTNVSDFISFRTGAALTDAHTPQKFR